MFASSRCLILLLVAFGMVFMPMGLHAQDLDELLDDPGSNPSVPDQLKPGAPGGKTSTTTSDDFTVITVDNLRRLPMVFNPLAPFLSFFQKILEDLIAWWNEPSTPSTPPQISATPPSTTTPPVSTPPVSTPPVPPTPGTGSNPGTPTPPTDPAVPPTPVSPPSPPVAGVFPVPPDQPITGSRFMSMTDGMTPAQREQEAVRVILAGHIPNFIRQFAEIKVKMKISNREYQAVYRVLPDYLTIGTDADFIRMPMSPIAGQKIADQFQCLLPTSKMVDDIYAQAVVQLYPQPMSNGTYPNWEKRMRTNEFYREQHRLVESQRAKTSHQLGQLLAGHRKDVLVSNFLNTYRANVVIYGWHDKRNRGRPIQGYGFGHENTYEDYSHGIRLIHQTMEVDGQKMATVDVLKDPVLHRLISREGPVKDPRAIR
jgi:hypothetical protein